MPEEKTHPAQKYSVTFRKSEPKKNQNGKRTAKSQCFDLSKSGKEDELLRGQPNVSGFRKL